MQGGTPPHPQAHTLETERESSHTILGLGGKKKEKVHLDSYRYGAIAKSLLCAHLYKTLYNT